MTTGPIKMRQEVEIDGRQLVVELDGDDGLIKAAVDGQEYLLEVTQPERGSYLIKSRGRVYEAVVWGHSRSMQVSLRGRLFSARVVDRKHRGVQTEHSNEGRQQLTAPMPGKIIRVLLEVGESVAAGQGVVVVEAMKMQNEIKSPKPGRVVEMRVSEGDAVSANQVLAVVE